MGTLSKRPLSDFGHDLRDRIEKVRTGVGGKLDDLQGRAGVESRHEGARTVGIERLTASLPSTTWLALAGASLAGAIALKASGKSHASLLVGQWVPTFLIVGLYNKLVKVAGSERRTSGA